MIYLSPPPSPLLALQAGRRAAQGLGTSVASAATLRCGSGFDFVYFDPRRSSPNLVLGIQSPSIGEVELVSPGECAPISPRDTAIKVFRATAAPGGTNGWILLGFGTKDELPVFASRRTLPPIWPYDVLVANLSAPPGVMCNPFPTHGLRGLKVAVFPVDAAGLVVDPTPAAFTVDVIFETVYPEAVDDVQYNGFETGRPTTWEDRPLPDHFLRTMAAFPGGLVAQQTVNPGNGMAFEVEVPKGSPLMRFSSLNFVPGAVGVVRVGIVVSGDPRY